MSSISSSSSSPAAAFFDLARDLCGLAAALLVFFALVGSSLAADNVYGRQTHLHRQDHRCPQRRDVLQHWIIYCHVLGKVERSATVDERLLLLYFTFSPMTFRVALIASKLESHPPETELGALVLRRLDFHVPQLRE